MMALAQIVDQYRGGNEVTASLAAQFGIEMPMPAVRGGKPPAEKVEETEALGGEEGPKEASNTKKARQRVADSTSPA